MDAVERVARVICLSQGGLDPDLNYDPKGLAPDMENIRWRLFIPQAKAAIEAYFQSPMPKPMNKGERE